MNIIDWIKHSILFSFIREEYYKFLVMREQSKNEQEELLDKAYSKQKVEEILARHPIYTEEPAPYEEDWLAWYFQNHEMPERPWEVHTLQQARIRARDKAIEESNLYEDRTTAWRCGQIARPDFLGGNYRDDLAKRIRRHPGGISGYFDEYDRRRRLAAEREPSAYTYEGKPNTKWADWYQANHPKANVFEVHKAWRAAARREIDTIEAMISEKGKRDVSQTLRDEQGGA